jgi:hypothetical protein
MKMSDADRAEALDALGGIIASKRKEAIDARESSGIEAIWMACEEAYLGIDDANRSEFANAKWAKPTSMQGPVTVESVRNDESRSTAFVRLTSRYVDAGAAKLAEILLPADDKAFSFGPTPIPEMVESQDDMRPAVGPDGAPIMRAPDPAAPVAGPAPVPGTPVAPPDQVPPAPGAPSQPAAPAPQPVTIADMAKQVMDEAKDKAEKAEKRIYDWMIECGYQAENRKVIHDCARIGVGVLKGPFPEMRKAQAMVVENGVKTLKQSEKIKPASKWIDAWNLFPDGACGENIHHGDHIFERDYLAPRLLKDLKKQKGYLEAQIDKVIKEGPEKCNEDGANPNEKQHKNRFQVWYFYGTLTAKEMRAANAIGIDEKLKDGDDVYAIITMVNDSVIRASINPLGSGRFPYNAMPWSRRAGSWAGVGVGEQVGMPQRMCNAGTRALLNNAGITCGPQIIIDRQSIMPGTPGDWTIRPNKIWFLEPDAQIKDVTKAFTSIEIQNIGAQLMPVIEYAMRLAEEASSIPLISQGQTGPTTPDTLGATQLQNNNANTLLRAIGYGYDDHITDPVVHAYYEWLMLDPSVPDEEKGDFEINAHGSAAMVERAIQDQTLAQMGQMVLNPVFGVDPKKWFAEWMKSKRLDPRAMQYTEEEQAKMAQTPPPPPVPIAVAQINAASHEKIAGMSAQQPGQPAQPDTSAQTAQISANAKLQEADMRAKSAEQVATIRAKTEMSHIEVERQIAADNANARHQERMDERELLLLKYSLENKMTLDQVKVDLAKTSMLDETKKQLAAAEIQLAESEGDKDRMVGMHQHNASLVRDEIATEKTP